MKVGGLLTFLILGAIQFWPFFAFSQQVDTAWVRRYNGPGNGDDRATAIAVDSSGNVYVTGYSLGSVTGYDYCTIKYLPNGDTGWVRRYDGPTSKHDYAVALGLDKSGRVYVTGRSDGEFATVKYDSEGNELWVRRLGSLFALVGNGAYAMTLDTAGNIYVTGQLPDDESLPMGVTIKYNKEGDIRWTSYGGAATPFQRGVGIVADDWGNAYATGLGGTIKYDSMGNQLWNRDLPGNCRSIALDNSGNIFAVGDSGSYHPLLTKYSSDGDTLWTQRLIDPLYRVTIYGTIVASDIYDNVIVIGRTVVPPDLYLWEITKYDSVGNQLWHSAWHGYPLRPSFTLTLSREPNAVALDSLANIYVTGRDQELAASIKYSPEGEIHWVERYGDYDAVGWTEMYAIATDQRGSIYVTGDTDFETSDFLTIGYSPLPQLKGDLSLDGTLSLFDVVLALNCVFVGEPPPAAPSACDLNCDGKVMPADVSVLLLMVFAAMPASC